MTAFPSGVLSHVLQPQPEHRGYSLSMADANGRVRQRYEAIFAELEQRTLSYRTRVVDALNARKLPHYVESRTKPVDSFLRKSQEPPFAGRDALAEMHDVCGLRIIVASLSDVEVAEEIVAREFTCDPQKSTLKGAEFESYQFGYRARHLICSDSELEATLTPEGVFPQVEIQIRSLCENAWALVDRLVRYKTSLELSPGVERRIFSLAAVLEVCDSEIEGILSEWRSTLKSAREAFEIDPSTELSIETFAAYVDSSSVIDSLASSIQANGVRVGSMSHLSRDIRILRAVGVTSVGQLGNLVGSVEGTSPMFFEAMFRELRDLGVAISSIERNAIATLIAIAVNHTQFTDERLRNEFAYGLGWAALGVAGHLAS